MPTAPARTEDALGRELAAYLTHLQSDRGLSANTLGAYRRDLARYVRYLAAGGVADVDVVSPQLVQAFVRAVRAGTDGGSTLTATSAARAASAVRGWHRFLLARGRSAVDPARDVRPPAPPRRAPVSLTVAQVERLLEEAGRAGGAVAARDRALLEVLYATGARISEVVGLDLSDAPGSAESVVHLGGAAGEPRPVPLGVGAATALEAYLGGSRPALLRQGPGSPALFLNSRGGRLSRQSAWAVLQAAADRAGLSGPVSPHTLRHSFATHRLAEGADVHVVQQLLGHASPSSTQVYALTGTVRSQDVHLPAPPATAGVVGAATKVVAAPAVGPPDEPFRPSPEEVPPL